jgi:hypothetical protein
MYILMDLLAYIIYILKYIVFVYAVQHGKSSEYAINITCELTTVNLFSEISFFPYQYIRTENQSKRKQKNKS